MPRSFAEVADQFRFVGPINTHDAIRIVQAWFDNECLREDPQWRVHVRLRTSLHEPFECDGCGTDCAKKFTMEQVHPEGGNTVGDDCWFIEANKR